MKLDKKKMLASRTLGIGKQRIHFVTPRLNEIKDAITKQDIRDLVKEGAIVIKENKGRRKIRKRAKKRGAGKVHLKVNRRKREYIIITRKLREYVANLKENGEINQKEYEDIRKKIRNRFFKSKANLKEHIGGLER